METSHLFTAALGLAAPWKVVDVMFRPAESQDKRGELVLQLDFPRSATFPCPKCDAPAKAFDTAERKWRHLDFFEHECLLTARCPRVDCPEHGVASIDLPWEGTRTRASSRSDPRKFQDTHGLERVVSYSRRHGCRFSRFYGHS